MNHEDRRARDLRRARIINVVLVVLTVIVAFLGWEMKQ